jgi:hypothetical protein
MLDMVVERQRSVQRILVMSCGKRKRPDTTLLPALERYDGPSFHVLRRYLASHPASPPDVYILSSRFGLIPAGQPIPNYDQRLTPQRAAELQPALREALTEILSRREYKQIYLAVGREYAQALDGYEALVPTAASVIVARGSQGRRIAQLYDWLYGPARRDIEGVPRAVASRETGRYRKTPRLRGVEIALTADQALVRARQALAANSRGCDRFHSWYILLDGRRIAPKWLMTQLSGLPTSAFTTQEALWVLAHIGIVVHRAETC